MAEPLIVSDPSQKQKIYLMKLFIALFVIAFGIFFLRQNTDILGYEVPPSATGTNFATNTLATVSVLTEVRTQTQRLDCFNNALTDVLLGLGTTTNINNSGTVLRASSTFSWTAENGQLYTGKIYTSGTVAATGNIKCTQIP